jgi:hypothetical protein
MTSYDTSSRSGMAYAISRRRYLASAILIVGSVTLSTFIVAYCLTTSFGHTEHVSTTFSSLLSFAVGGISSGLYLIDDRESWNRTS